MRLVVLVTAVIWTNLRDIGAVVPEFFHPENQLNCFTPDGTIGQCIFWSNCHYFNQLLRQFNQRKRLFDHLQRSVCGFVIAGPKVCCPLDKPPTRPTKTNLTFLFEPKQATRPPAQIIHSFPSASNDVLPEQCGVARVASDRIVGGKEAQLGAWPWMAVLLYRNEINRTIHHQCDGVLITNQHILTAAHCLDSNNTLVRVRLGDHQTNTNKDGVALQDVEISQILRHPKYNRSINHHDLAIVKLRHRVEFTENVQPICLPRSESLISTDLTGKFPMVAGWGRTSENGNGSKVLREVSMTIVSTTSCRDAYSTIPNVVIDETVICAGFNLGGRGFCQGDSGGPLMLPFGPEDRWHLFGVVSHAVGCARARFPGIYVRVVHFMDWIMNNL